MPVRRGLGWSGRKRAKSSQLSGEDRWESVLGRRFLPTLFSDAAALPWLVGRAGWAWPAGWLARRRRIRLSGIDVFPNSGGGARAGDSFAFVALFYMTVESQRLVRFGVELNKTGRIDQRWLVSGNSESTFIVEKNGFFFSCWGISFLMSPYPSQRSLFYFNTKSKKVNFFPSPSKIYHPRKISFRVTVGARSTNRRRRAASPRRRWKVPINHFLSITLRVECGGWKIFVFITRNVNHKFRWTIILHLFFIKSKLRYFPIWKKRALRSSLLTSDNLINCESAYHPAAPRGTWKLELISFSNEKKIW